MLLNFGYLVGETILSDWTLSQGIFRFVENYGITIMGMLPSENLFASSLETTIQLSASSLEITIRPTPSDTDEKIQWGKKRKNGDNNNFFFYSFFPFLFIFFYIFGGGGDSKSRSFKFVVEVVVLLADGDFISDRKTGHYWEWCWWRLWLQWW